MMPLEADKACVLSYVELIRPEVWDKLERNIQFMFTFKREILPY